MVLVRTPHGSTTPREPCSTIGQSFGVSEEGTPGTFEPFRGAPFLGLSGPVRTMLGVTRRSREKVVRSVDDIGHASRSPSVDENSARGECSMETAAAKCIADWIETTHRGV